MSSEPESAAGLGAFAFYASTVGANLAARWAPGVTVQPNNTDVQAKDAGPSDAAAGTAGKKAAPAFRSSGLHQLGAYRPGDETAGPVITPRSDAVTGGASTTAASIQPPAADQPQRQSRIKKTGISADNVGYRLLKRSGWREGTGLGAEGQGRATPVEAHFNKGNRGIGFDTRGSSQHAAGNAQQPPSQQQQGKAQARQPKQGGRGSAEHAAAAARGAERRAKLAALVEAELAAEDVDTKVKRYKQVEMQEAEDARGKAIAASLRRAFNDPYDHATSADVNPLGKRHRLAANNPLNDPFEFG